MFLLNGIILIRRYCCARDLATCHGAGFPTSDLLLIQLGLRLLPSFLEVFPKLECRKKAAEYVWRLKTSSTLVFRNIEAVLLLLLELFVTYCVSAQLGQMADPGCQI